MQSKAGLLILQPATPANAKRGLVEIDSEEGDRFRGRRSSGGNAKKKKEDKTDVTILYCSFKK